jgi:pyruvate dehydrogenase E2 component (dihydrolipoamide acetyltransferase)
MTRIMNLPKLGVNMEEATIVSWKVVEGEEVVEGQPLFEAETDKAIQEFESTVTGVLEKILAPPGTTVACQQPVAAFRVSSGAPGDGPGQRDQESSLGESVEAPSASQAAGDLKTVTSAREGRPQAGRLRISPLARRTARALGIDPAVLSPSKTGARIVKRDVLAGQPRRGAGDGAKIARIPLTGIRGTIAARMSQSAREAAITIRVRADGLLKWREELKARGASANLSVLVAVLAAKALQRFPALNAELSEYGIELHREINIGVAVDSERGLMVPVLRRVSERSVEALHEEFRRLVAAVRSGRVTAADLAGGTFTITNLGAFGIESFVPIINPPQCAILALGAIAGEALPTETGEALEVCPVVRLTLVFDHRMVDGAPAARFLQYLKELMENGIEAR